jgi:hypothetical protein
MAHTGIFATSDEILVKAGENYDTSITEERINALCLQAESIINVATRYNWSDAYAALNVDFKGILSDAESSWVAIQIINFNMSGFNSRAEAQLMMNVLRDNFVRDLEILKDMKQQDFMV